MRISRLYLTQEKIVIGIAEALFVVFSVTLSRFFVAENLFTLIRNVSALGILATAMAVVVLGRGIDLSIGAPAHHNNLFRGGLQAGIKSN